MKHEFHTMPEAMKEIDYYGCSWMDFLTAIPSPIFLATSFKSNGKANACLQSWATFAGDTNGFYCIMAAVGKNGHLYQTIRETGVVALNFFGADLYEPCEATIRNNGFDVDELAASGLAWEPCATIRAPKVSSAFLTLECAFAWEKDLHEGGSLAAMCVQVKNVVMDEAYFDDAALGRYGQTGYLYNIHSPVNPLTGKIGATGLGVLEKHP